jgi:hypothetical protein
VLTSRALTTPFLKMPGRRTTVYDLTNLRLHADGKRVKRSPQGLAGSVGAKKVVQDVRGNWIANDAGGSGTVKRRKTRRQIEDDSDGEVFDFTGIGDDTETIRAMKKGKQKACEVDAGTTVGDAKHKRRRNRIDYNFSFLDNSTPAQVPAESIDEAPLSESCDVPLPTSVYFFFSFRFCAMLTARFAGSVEMDSSFHQ